MRMPLFNFFTILFKPKDCSNFKVVLGHVSFPVINKLVSWSLTSIFSTNMAISETIINK